MERNARAHSLFRAREAGSTDKNQSGQPTSMSAVKGSSFSGAVAVSPCHGEPLGWVAVHAFVWAWENNPMPTPSFLYGTAWKEDRTAALTELALRAGFRGIDTANQRKHYFEAGVGQALAVVYEAGIVKRADLFLQTKFTYQRGQDHRLPYDPNASFSLQVAQSMKSSLEHLGTDYVDSYVLHGPSGYVWNDDDSEVWEAMRNERDAGRTRLLGVSNVSLQHLEEMLSLRLEPPAFVQNRCFARAGWDREVRAFCRERNIVYQGFSLLTANVDALRHPVLSQIASRSDATLAQVVFSFARSVGMLPLTGTSKVEHLEQDLASQRVELSTEDVQSIESLVG
jgi:diketogulonate reductase-like aldo/keto reductase